MSDTPETDALREAIDNGAAAEAEMTSLAGKFERERDEAREFFAIATDQCTVVYSKLREAIGERNEAREAFAVATSQLVQAQEAKRVLEGEK